MGSLVWLAICLGGLLHFLSGTSATFSPGGGGDFIVMYSIRPYDRYDIF